jgi:hypothetical protein
VSHQLRVGGQQVEYLEIGSNLRATIEEIPIDAEGRQLRCQ